MARRLIAEDRYVFVLLEEAADIDEPRRRLGLEGDRASRWR